MTGHFVHHIFILQHNNILQKTLKIFVVEILKDWAYLWCKHYIDCVILVKVCFLCDIFRDINESNGLKLQLFYKQFSRLNHPSVIINMKYFVLKSILLRRRVALRTGGGGGGG